LRICFVSHSPNLYGAERALLELIDSVRDLGVLPYVVLPAAGLLQEKLLDRGVTHAIIPFRSWMSRPAPRWKVSLRLASIPFSSLAIALQILRWRCDVVFSNTLSVCEGALAARMTGRPHVWSIHEFEYASHGLVFHLGEPLSLRLVNRLSSRCIACSEAVARRYKANLDERKVTVIYPSVTLSREKSDLPAPSERRRARMRCVVVGALTEGKRPEDAIRAVAHLFGSGMDVELVLVGGGDPGYEADLRRLVEDKRLDDRVEFTGYMDDPASVVQTATVVLVCSSSEAFGRVAVEAMLQAKPVIGTRRGGTLELIREGFNGLFYTPGDIDELARRIRFFYDHPDSADLMGNHGREWALGRFDADRYAAEVLALVRRAVAEKASVTPCRDADLS
jgi:glycosyltransferase involved in cell wall biosynthesis